MMIAVRDQRVKEIFFRIFRNSTDGRSRSVDSVITIEPKHTLYKSLSLGISEF